MSIITKTEDFEGAEAVVQRTAESSGFSIDTTDFVSGAQSLSSGQTGTVAADNATPTAKVHFDITGASSVKFKYKAAFAQTGVYNHDIHFFLRSGDNWLHLLSGTEASNFYTEPTAGTYNLIGNSVTYYHMENFAEWEVSAEHLARIKELSDGSPIELVVVYYLWNADVGNTLYIDDLVVDVQEDFKLFSGFSQVLASPLAEGATDMVLDGGVASLGLASPEIVIPLTIYTRDPETKQENAREVVHVTGVDAATNTLTIVGAQDRTTRPTGGWVAGAMVECRLTESTINWIRETVKANESAHASGGIEYFMGKVGSLDISGWNNGTLDLTQYSPGGIIVEELTVVQNAAQANAYDTTPAGLASIDTDFSGNLAASPDGTLLAVSHSVAPFLSVFTLATMATPTGADALGITSKPSDIAFNTAGTRMAVALGSGGLKVFDTTGYTEVTVAGAPTGTVTGVAFSPDDAYLAVTGATSPYLTVLNTGTWAAETLGAPLESEGHGVAFSPDSKYLLASREDSGEVVAYLTTDWSVDGKFNYSASSFAETMNITFHPNQHLVYVEGIPFAVGTWAKSYDKWADMPGIEGVSFSASGQYAAYFGGGGTSGHEILRLVQYGELQLELYDAEVSDGYAKGVHAGDVFYGYQHRNDKVSALDQSNWSPGIGVESGVIEINGDFRLTELRAGTAYKVPVKAPQLKTEMNWYVNDTGAGLVDFYVKGWKV